MTDKQDRRVPQDLTQARELIRENVPEAFQPGLVKLCSPTKQHTHRVASAAEDGTEIYEDIPCTTNRGKRPIEPGFTKQAIDRYGRASSGDFHFGTWLDDRAQALLDGHNLGLVPPPGVVVSDADTAAAVALLDSLSTPNTPVQSRPVPDSMHVWHRYDPQELPLKAKQLKWEDDGRPIHIDLRVGGKSQAVVCPSLHTSGKDYEWLNGLPDSIEDIPFLPIDLVRLYQSFHRHDSPDDAPVAQAGHERLLSYVNRMCRYAARVEEVRPNAEGFARTLYGDRPTRLAQVLAGGGELDRLIESGWERFGGANPLAEDGTDQCFVEILIASFGDSWRYDATSKVFWEWDGISWVQTTVEHIGGLIGRMNDTLFEDAARETNNQQRRERLAALSRKLRFARTVDAIIRRLKTLIPVKPAEFDSDPMLLTFPPGLGVPAVTLDLRTMQTFEPRKEDMITKTLGAPYVPGLKSGLYEEVLEETIPQEDQRQYMQRALGMALAGEGLEHVLLFLYGKGGTGKSTNLNAWASAFGQYAVKASFETFIGSSMISSGGAATPDIARMAGARLVICAEVPERARLGARMKDLTGGDRLQARNLYGTTFEFDPQFTVMVAGNVEPNADFSDSGVWRRVRQIPMEQIPKTVDRKLPQKLNAPEVKSAILQWALEGYEMFQRIGLGTCSAIEEASDQMRRRMNPIEDWFEDCCSLGPGETPVTDAYAHFSHWMDENVGRAADTGERRPSKKKFTELLVEKGVTRGRLHGGKRVYQGLILRKTNPYGPDMGQEASLRKD